MEATWTAQNATSFMIELCITPAGCLPLYNHSHHACFSKRLDPHVGAHLHIRLQLQRLGAGQVNAYQIPRAQQAAQRVRCS
eukprot:COSAG02_NODE_20689_length_819_cov_1.061111_1_plen_80_part_10